MPQFSPGEAKTATAPIVAKPAGMNCEAELFLGPDDLTKIASSGRVPFVSTGAAKNVSLPITMPTAQGTLKSYIDVFAEGLRFLAYKTTEDVQIMLPVPTKPILVYAYPAPAQVATGFSPPNSVYINYKVGIPDLTVGYLLIFLFGLEGIPWWVPGTPYGRLGCVRVVFAAPNQPQYGTQSQPGGYYEGSEQMYAKYSTGRFSSAHLLPGVYRLLSTCQLYREPGDYLVETYWSNVDTGEKITVV